MLFNNDCIKVMRTFKSEKIDTILKNKGLKG